MSTNPQPLPTDIARIAKHTPMFFATIETNRIDTQPQTRYEFDTTNAEALTESIRKEGILSPLLITEHPHDNRFTLVFGERRLRAAKNLQLPTVPAFITPPLTPERILELQIAENAYRVNLNDIDTTYATLALISVRLKRTPEETKSILYKIDNQKRRPNTKDPTDPTTIRIITDTIQELHPTSNLHLFIRTKLPLLNLPTDIETHYRTKRIDATHAILISRIKNPITQQHILHQTTTHHYTVEQLRDTIRKATEKPNNSVSTTLQQFHTIKKAITPLRYTKLPQQKRVQAAKLIHDLHALLKTETPQAAEETPSTPPEEPPRDRARTRSRTE
jgi:ParB family transcriptional regulator, chromosome partitioning protein